MSGTTEKLPNGHHAPDHERHDDSAAPTEAEVQTIVQSIKDASAAVPVAPTSSPSPGPESQQSPLQDETSSQPPQPAEFDLGEYWDLSSMAPLNQVSRVST